MTAALREYAEDGLTIIRAAIPPAALATMRREADRVLEVSREVLGPDATRPPGGIVGGRLLVDNVDRYDPAPFAAFAHLPKVRAAVDVLLGPDFVLDPDAFTALLNTTTRSICQRWHRDYRDNVPGTDYDAWVRRLDDLAYFNQFNAALYDDVSLWVVPGSHRRLDTDEEAHVLTGAGHPDRERMTEEEYVVAAARYRRSMPGATQVVLAPGDVAFYRDSAIHLGHYIPTATRFTLHGHFENDETRAYFTQAFALAGR